MENKLSAGENRRRTSGDRRHSSSRERILREIEVRPASTADLVAATGLHENTVRGHLERLLADGHITREQEAPSGRGRPSLRWHAVGSDGTAPYAGLAVALAEGLARTSDQPAQEAKTAGRIWGAQLAQDRAEADPRALVLEVMREQGFAPDASTGEQTVLRNCPLLAAASRRSDVVCAVHEGLIEGLARTRAEGATAKLLPFAADGACILHLQVAS
ncbi:MULTISPECIES: metalloregulator ArsR/SmtB family transcription factor [unclassified Microbacterium]|uniref:helix-turn-helix transcriptional regulator n=1 Tax=unclassified Microbacterium TaxID=2609290 RepID=UPI0012FCC70A|nr:transcriptional regulator [Microbacterium sp. MAH-37]MVQ42691.1 transcriptional regulator [Microbacterium sp. MAH-37]